MPPLGYATFAAFAIAVIKVVVVSLVVGFITRLLLPRPKLGDFGIQARTVTVREPVATRRVVLGNARIGGVIVYMTTTNDDKDLHIVIALCDAPEGPVTAIDAVWVDGVPILAQDLDAGGNVVIGRFAGVMRIKKFLGAAPQTADADLVAEVTEWTTDHRLDGIAGLYVRLQRDPAAFPGGLPNISADVRGLAVPDPRDAGFRWSRNIALQQRWLLTTAEWGIGAPYDSALNFDGTSNYVTIGDGSEFQFGTGDFTVELWVRFNSLGATPQQLFLKRVVGGGNFEIQTTPVTDVLSFIIGGSALPLLILPGTTTILIDTIYHIALSRISGTATLYLNGLSEASGASLHNINSINPAVIGRDSVTTPPSEYLDGAISDVRLWNVGRTDAQILANKDQRLAGTETGLVGYWKLDDGSGAIAADSTSADNDGTISGPSIWPVSPFGQATAGGAVTEIDEATAIAAANLAEEIIPVAVIDDQGAPIEDDFTAKLATDWFTRLTTTAPFSETTARPVKLSTTGTLPAPLIVGRTYYAIADEKKDDVFRLAAGAEDARNEIAIPITDTGTGTHTLTVTITKNKKDEDPQTTIFTDDFVAQATPDRLLRSGDKIGWRRGDTVRLTTDGGLPPPLLTATDYFVMPDAGGGFRLAVDYAAAIADTAIAITGPGTGTHTVTRTAEARYAGGGLIAANVTRKSSLEALLTASGGRAVWLGGLWSLYGAAARTSALTLAEADLRGNIKVTTKAPRRDRFNAVQGLYHAPDANGQPASYPKLASTAFKAADGGEEIIHQVDLPFTDSSATCQRLAKIELLRARQEIEFVSSFSLKGLQLRATDWFSMDNVRFGWTAKIFECSQWQLAVDGTPPALTIRMTGHESAASDFDWATSEEQTVDPAPDTDLPSPWDLTAPAGLAMTETLYETRDGAGVKSRANLSWARALEGHVNGYEIQYRSTKATEWIEAKPVAEALVAIDDIAPDIYEFRVRSLGRGGQVGPWSELLEVEINGLLAPPAIPTGLAIQTIGALAILTWDRHPDLDVRIGGRMRIRWSPAETGAAWDSSTEATDPVNGDATLAVAPLRQGSYLVRAYDSSKIPSPLPAIVSTRAAEHINFTTLSTITESPNYAGGHSGTVAIDGILKLAGLGLFDSIPDIDLVADLDSFGGIGGSGVYSFDGGIDLGSVKTVRLTASVTAQTVNVLDKIDDRTALIDSWEDFDGAAAGDADLQVFFRETDDDPAGAPVFGPFRRLTAADRNARAFEFEARLSTTDPAYNIHNTALSVTAEEIV